MEAPFPLPTLAHKLQFDASHVQQIATGYVLLQKDVLSLPVHLGEMMFDMVVDDSSGQIHDVVTMLEYLRAGDESQKSKGVYFFKSYITAGLLMGDAKIHKINKRWNVVMHYNVVSVLFVIARKSTSWPLRFDIVDMISVVSFQCPSRLECVMRCRCSDGYDALDVLITFLDPTCPHKVDAALWVPIVFKTLTLLANSSVVYRDAIVNRDCLRLIRDYMEIGYGPVTATAREVSTLLRGLGQHPGLALLPRANDGIAIAINCLSWTCSHINPDHRSACFAFLNQICSAEGARDQLTEPAALDIISRALRLFNGRTCMYSIMSLLTCIARGTIVHRYRLLKDDYCILDTVVNDLSLREGAVPFLNAVLSDAEPGFVTKVVEAGFVPTLLERGHNRNSDTYEMEARCITVICKSQNFRYADQVYTTKLICTACAVLDPAECDDYLLAALKLLLSFLEWQLKEVERPTACLMAFVGAPEKLRVLADRDTEIGSIARIIVNTWF